MTDRDDKLSRRYRELAREAPSASVDATILARARRRAPGHRRSWFVPVSIAAVLMLGVGVTLRMQMEEPGIETSAPKRELPARTPESPPPAASTVDAVKAAEAPAAQPQPEARAKSRLAAPAKPAAPPVPMQDRADAAPREEDSSMAMPGAPGPIAPPAANFVPSPPPAAANRAALAIARDQGAPASRAAPAAAAAGSVTTLESAEPQRARQEAQADAYAAKELKKSVALPDRDAELERIAKLREAGKHSEADRALEEFRKRYPDFRIPEAMWERVRPR